MDIDFDHRGCYWDPYKSPLMESMSCELTRNVDRSSQPCGSCNVNCSSRPYGSCSPQRLHVVNSEYMGITGIPISQLWGPCTCHEATWSLSGPKLGPDRLHVLKECLFLGRGLATHFSRAARQGPQESGWGLWNCPSLGRHLAQTKVIFNA